MKRKLCTNVCGFLAAMLVGGWAWAAPAPTVDEGRAVRAESHAPPASPPKRDAVARSAETPTPDADAADARARLLAEITAGGRAGCVRMHFAAALLGSTASNEHPTDR